MRLRRANAEPVNSDNPPNHRQWRHPTRIATLVVVVWTVGAMAVAGVIVALLFDVPWVPAVVAMVAVAILLGFKGCYRTRMVPDVSSMFSRLLTAVALGVVMGLSVARLTPAPVPTIGDAMGLVAGLWTGAVVGLAFSSRALKSLWSRGRLRSRALVVGVGKLTSELILELRVRRTYGVYVEGVAYVGTEPPSRGHPAETPFVAVADIPRFVADHNIDRVIIGPSAGDDPTVVAGARWAAAKGLPVYVVPRLFTMGVGLDSLTPDRVRGYPLVRVQRSAHPQIALRFKRLTDVVVSGIGIVLTAPIMAVAAMAVRLTSPGPALFRQERVGQHGKPIVVSKFRSMTTGDGDNEWTSESRVTPVGGFLRRTSVDELPQLFAIFRGDMSLVGPRPERPAFVEKFRQQYAEYDERHRMPVGLTGLAQVVGYVGDTSIEERLKYDNLYIDQWSYGTDMQLVFKTVWSVVRQGKRKKEHRELTNALRQGSAINLVDSDIDLRDGAVAQERYVAG